MKLIALILLTVIMLVLASFSALAYTSAALSFPGDEPALVTCGGGMYLVGCEDRDVHIIRCDQPDPSYETITVQYPVAGAGLFGDTVIVLCNDVPNDQMIVFLCGLVDGSRDSFIVPNCLYETGHSFSYDGSVLFLTDDNDPSAVQRFSNSGKRLSSYRFNSSDTLMISGYRGGSYVLADGALYRCGAGGYHFIGGLLHTPAVFFSDDLLIDAGGCVYRVDDSGTELLFTVDTDGSCAAALSSDGTIYCAGEGAIYRYDMTGRKTEYFETGYSLSALYFRSGYLYALSDGGSPASSRISPSEFSPVAFRDKPTGSGPVSSDVYTVDHQSYRITRIPSSTTFAQFKSHMYYDGYQAQLYRDVRMLKSGNVGTAMTVVFSGESTYTYELSVIGDVTGEGSVNSRDLNELMDYFLGNIRFDGVYTDAADISDDGRVDLLDLALLCRMAAK